MTSASHQADVIKPIRQAMYAFGASSVQSALADVLAADARNSSLSSFWGLSGGG